MEEEKGKNEFTRICHSRQTKLQEVSQLSKLASLGNKNVVQVTEWTSLRSLTPLEIQTLQNQCRCSHNQGWSQVRLLLNSSEIHQDQSTLLQLLISDTRFDGFNVFDLTVTKGIGDNTVYDDLHYHKLPAGVHSNLMISNSILKVQTCRVYKNSFISNTYIGSNCAVLNCGDIAAAVSSTTKSARTTTNYGHLNIQVGPESGGGRDLNLTSESTMIDVCTQLRQPIPSTSSNSFTSMNILDDSCLIRDTPTIQSVYMHGKSSIEAAISVKNATLFPNSKIAGGSKATDVLLQWDASIVDNSTVSETLLMEQSQSGPNSLVASSVLGPDVHVSAGEIHSSIMGPNTSAHHQSLIIGILWPMGRGNVGYGANVGSNHTGRIPDQETAAGEGTFWGLSCVIKFPVDLTFSPYSIVAAGTTLPPQRICMPFSLIVDGKDGKNDIIPGWVLQSSPYTLARSEKKFATRRKAKRHDFYTGWKIFRPEIMDMCRCAKAQLLLEASRTNGLGTNNLSDRARTAGIKAYRECLQRYALHGLLAWIRRVSSENSGGIVDVNAIHYELLGRQNGPLTMPNPTQHVEWPSFPWDEKDFGDEWEYQRSLVLEEFPFDNTSISDWLEKLLSTLVTLENDFSRRIHKCKARDDSRGEATIPGYAQAHVLADKDPVIIDAKRRASAVEGAVSKILGSIIISSPNTRCRL